MWDATQYLKYADERARPFFDLLARVQCDDPKLIADLGCGPGNLTRTLAERWPAARVIGVDSSAAMLAKATPMLGRLDFIQADLSTWGPAAPLDLIVSNAALQWVSNHEKLLPRLASLLAPAGILAVQIPYHVNNPAHLTIEAIKNDDRWRSQLAGVGLNQESFRPTRWYVEQLLDLDLSVDAWETTYVHVLAGANPVLEWFKGTALRPLLDKLDAKEQAEFLDDMGRRFLDAYPARNGRTLLPFPRTFFVATRSS